MIQGVRPDPGLVLISDLPAEEHQLSDLFRHQPDEEHQSGNRHEHGRGRTVSAVEGEDLNSP